MTFDPAVLIVLIFNLLLLAAAWGDLRRQVTSDRERNTERHAESQTSIRELKAEFSSDLIEQLRQHEKLDQERYDNTQRELVRLSHLIDARKP